MCHLVKFCHTIKTSLVKVVSSRVAVAVLFTEALDNKQVEEF